MEEEKKEQQLCLASDLHLEAFARLENSDVATRNGVIQRYLNEMLHIDDTKTRCSICVIAGDLGNPWFQPAMFRAALAHLSASYEHVIYVPGNHEYYNLKIVSRVTVEDVDECLRDVCCELPNVHLLQHGASVTCNGVTFVGTTLWSDTSGDETIALYGMTDYRMILGAHETAISPATTALWHQRERAELKKALQKYASSPAPLVVVTHHLPSYRLIGEAFAGDDMNAAFASRCDELLATFQPAAWLCGHSHVRLQRTIEGVPCYVHAIGYPDEVQGPPVVPCVIKIPFEKVDYVKSSSPTK